MRTLSLMFAICLAMPLYAQASCETAAPPSYDDITYIAFRQSSLVGQLRPQFNFEAILLTGVPKTGAQAAAFLNAERATTFQGRFVAMDSFTTFRDALSVLQEDRFFAMRLHTTTQLYLDGPEDAITVARCGIATTIGTLPYGSEVSLDDDQARAFIHLETDLRTAIFSEQWSKPTPPP